ncbi:Tgs1 protein [Infundibulicybe gibba]|nr:Tgs1 protein [Infundibulicybe gibba]
MGKRKTGGGLSGISRFMSVAFQPSEPTPDHELPTPPKSTGPSVKEIKKTVTTSDEYLKKYDATGLVPHYTQMSEVPEHLKKYFSQRTRFFSLYSTPPGCLLDEEGWYSVTPELIADQIAERCRCDTILDAFCGVGGNAIAFAKTCQRVIALDTSPTRLALARHNAQIYGVADRIEFILTDYISFANAYLSLPSSSSQNSSPSNRKIDVVFLSPPWGGPQYLSSTFAPEDSSPTPQIDHPTYHLSSIRPIHGNHLFDLSRRITQNIAYYLPRNTCLDGIANLASGSALSCSCAIPTSTLTNVAGVNTEMVEVEEEWMGNKLKALTCYYGGLAGGQESMF